VSEAAVYLHCVHVHVEGCAPMGAAPPTECTRSSMLLAVEGEQQHDQHHANQSTRPPAEGGEAAPPGFGEAGPFTSVTAASSAHQRTKRSGTRIRPNNAARHQQLSSWLVQNFGLPLLRRGAGILDVAGGAGGLAFELAFRWDLPVTVVDPREIKATSKQRRALRCRARYHQGVHDAGANDDDRDVHGGETADGVDVLRSGATGETRNATDAASADSGGSADRETRSVYAPSAASLRHAAEVRSGCNRRRHAPLAAHLSF